MWTCLSTGNVRQVVWWSWLKKKNAGGKGERRHATMVKISASQESGLSKTLPVLYCWWSVSVNVGEMFFVLLLDAWMQSCFKALSDWLIHWPSTLHAVTGVLLDNFRPCTHRHDRPWNLLLSNMHVSINPDVLHL